MGNERRFIAACLGIYLGDRNPSILKKLEARTDFSKLDEIVFSQEIPGLFHHLDDTGVFSGLKIPDEMKDRWKLSSWKNVFENDIRDKEAGAICHALSAKEARYVYLKGASVRSFHKEAGIKSSADIDIFINKEDYPVAKKILLSRNYEIPDLQRLYPGNNYTLEEYEKNMSEITFVRNEVKLRLIVDVQWDFVGMGHSAIFNELYSINEYIDNNTTETAVLGDIAVRTMEVRKQFYPLAFHYAYHHGFKGLKWLLDMGIIYSSPGIEPMTLQTNIPESGKKAVGICIMLLNDLMGLSPLSKEQTKSLFVDRLLPFEYRLYKSMLFNQNKGFLNSLSHRLIKIMLPYRHRDKFRVMGDILFNPKSIQHRLASKSGRGGFRNVLSVLKLTFNDMVRGKKKNE